MSTKRPTTLVSRLAAIALIAVGMPGFKQSRLAAAPLGSEPTGAQAGSSIAGTENGSVAAGGGMVPVGLTVDAASGAATVSNINGVLEPGESVAVDPTWYNNIPYCLGSMEGSLTSFTGPAGGIYSLHDASADYYVCALRRRQLVVELRRVLHRLGGRNATSDSLGQYRSGRCRGVADGPGRFTSETASPTCR